MRSALPEIGQAIDMIADAAAVHPYSFVLGGLRDLKKQNELREADFKTAVEDLWMGKEDAFQRAIQVMTALAP